MLKSASKSANDIKSGIKTANCIKSAIKTVNCIKSVIKSVNDIKSAFRSANHIMSTIKSAYYKSANLSPNLESIYKVQDLTDKFTFTDFTAAECMSGSLKSGRKKSEFLIN